VSQHLRSCIATICRHTVSLAQIFLWSVAINAATVVALLACAIFFTRANPVRKCVELALVAICLHVTLFGDPICNSSGVSQYQHHRFVFSCHELVAR